MTDLGPCILFEGPVNHHGYAWKTRRGGSSLVHRAVYEEVKGPIPPGMQIDHLCHTLDAACPGGSTCPHHRCINPDHLEAVTPRENVLRGRTGPSRNAVKTHCPAGHAYTEDNIIMSNGKRSCRRCDRDRQAVKKATRATQAVADGREPGRRGRPKGPQRPPGYYYERRLASMTPSELAEHRAAEAKRLRQWRERQAAI